MFYAKGLSPNNIFLPCAQGVESLLSQECHGLLAEKNEIQPLRGGVRVLRADAHTVFTLNLESRLAQRVLWPLTSGPYRDERDIYDACAGVSWPQWITPRQTLRVDTSAWRSPLKSLNFATLRVKDAVCDTLREATGERPSVDTRHPHLALVLYLGPDYFTLYVDTSGEALFKRGWRDARGGSVDVKGEAPLKETLAAAMLAAAGWQGRASDGALLDPCCGAGTIAIEAAQMACGMAPGLQRRFAFEHLAPFALYRQDWQQIRAAAQNRIHSPDVPIFAGDVSFRMTDFAQQNAQRAGVAHAIIFKTADALQRPAPADTGVIMMNPPYGERIAPKGRGQNSAEFTTQSTPRENFETGDASVFYSGLATHWKRRYGGWTAWLLTPEAKLPSLLRLKESRRIPLHNGPIECRLFRFDMVAGSARKGSENENVPSLPTNHQT